MIYTVTLEVEPRSSGLWSRLFALFGKPAPRTMSYTANTDEETGASVMAEAFARARDRGFVVVRVANVTKAGSNPKHR